MTTRLTTEAFNDALESQAGMPASPSLGTKRARSPERNLSTNDPLLQGSTEVGKKGSRDVEVIALPKPLLIESYKPQKSKIRIDNGAFQSDSAALWQTIQPTLQQVMSSASYQTWITSCQAISFEKGRLTLLVESDFNRELIQKRYRKTIEQALLIQTGQALTLCLRVDASAAATLPATTQATSEAAQKADTALAPAKSSWAAHQNPTNDPEVAILLERYGDMRGVILDCKLFEKPCTPIEQGGWGISVGAMITAGKQHTLAQVLWAIRQTVAYRGANNRGKLFYHILRKGLEASRRPS